MADISTAIEQDAIADSLVSEETTATAPVEAPEAEQPQEAEVSEQPVEQDEAQLEQEDAEWLPTEQDKVFPDEVLQRYCQRYGLDEQMLANPQLRQLVIDKINTDIYLQQQQQQEPEVEQEAELEPTQLQQPQLSREQYFQQLTQAIQQRTDPEVAAAFHSEFLNVWNLPANQQPMALASVTSKYMLNLVSTFLPEMLQANLSQQLGQAYPGFGDMYERSSHALAWDRVRNSDPKFASLPAYGTKDFTSKLLEAAAKIPGFDDMQFTDAQGRPLSMQQNAERKYAMLAKIASGQNVDPALLQRAAAQGARNARRGQITRSAGNLGSGQSKSAGASGSSKFATNSDLFDDATMEIYRREHGRL